MTNIFKFFRGIRLLPVASTAASEKGDIEVLTTGGKLNYHNGTTVSPVLTEAHAADITAKTLLEVDNIRVDLNTVSSTSGALNLTPVAGSAVVIDTSMTVDGGVVAITGDLTVDNLNLNGNSLTSSSGAINLTPIGGSAVVIDTSVTIDGGAVDITGDLDVDNINLNGNIISSTNANGDLNLTPNGNGKVKVESGSGKGLDVQSAGAMPIGATVGANNLTLGGSSSTVVIPGNLQVDGTTVTLNVTNLDVEDKNITVNDGGNDAASEGAGLTVERTGTSGSIIYKDASATKFALGAAGSEDDVVGKTATQTVTGKTFSQDDNTFSGFTARAVITANSSGNLGNGVAPGTSGNVLTSDGTDWTSATPSTAPDQSYEISNLGLTASVAANALTIALKGKDGNDPSGSNVVKVGFRNATVATGTYLQRSVTGALSLVISSGSTLGHASAIAHYIYVYLIDNAGTPELAVSSSLYDEGSVVSTTTEGGAGAADSNRTIYSTTGRSNVPVRLVGRLKSTQATAGTWATAISEISLKQFQDIPVVLHANGTVTGTLNGSYNDMILDTKVKDSHNAYDASTGIFTAPVGGTYQVTAYAFILGTYALNSTAQLVVSVDNSATYSLMGYRRAGGAVAVETPNVSGAITVTAGQTIRVKALTDSTSPSYGSAVAWNNGLTIHLIR